MKAPREIKRYAAVARKLRGKPNGVVRWLFDHPKYERMFATNKRAYSRSAFPKEWC